MKRLILPVLVLLLFARQAPAQYSPEEARRIVAGWYERFLGREPDPPSRIWVEKLMRGWRDHLPHPAAHVLAQILSSQEYYNKAGDTPQGFVNLLYRQLTGSPPLPRELQYWVNRIYREHRYAVGYAMVLRYSPGGPAGRPARDRDYEYHRPYWRNWNR